ncbi:DUF2332 domain-containing protein [Rhodovulum sp. DZ06]|uniref:DUF2332 domain-containing protein n=1 Tax=Rhodovulum sp. DZ06 TaxID=3425126 RepID=UPI003D341BA6
MRNAGPQEPISTAPRAGEETGEAAIRAAFARQGKASAELGSPFMAALMFGLAGAVRPGDPVSDALLAWPGRPFADALPLRIAGGLHALARAGTRPALSAAWSAPPPFSPETLAGAAMQAFAEDPDALLPWLASPPQTNEPGRSAILLGGALVAAARHKMPFELLEIGASAGLNLLFDRYAYDLGPENGGERSWGPADAPRFACTWSGAAPDLSAPLSITSRAACDLNPVDASDPAARARMLAYVWPDQHARRARVEAALALAAAAPPPEAADAADWIAARLAAPQATGTARLAVHTIMRQYVPEATRAAIDAAFAGAGARATAAAPLLRLSLEPDGRAPGASIRLQTWPGGRTEFLGRGCYHGRWADWAPRAA